MKIAIIGTRGVPGRYGGFETIAEALSLGLVAKGHRVCVYCRKGNLAGSKNNYRKINLVYVPFFNNKYLGTLSHTFLSIIYSLSNNYDVYIVFNIGVTPLCLILKLLGKKVILNVDGFEWYRRKWNIIAKFYFIICAVTARFFTDEIITDSMEVQKYYRGKLFTQTKFIPNGAEIFKSADKSLLDEYAITPQEYFFTASRLVPENNIELLIKSFSRLNTDKKLLIAGGTSHSEGYYRKLVSLKNERIFFLGPVYDPARLTSLHHYCLAYFHGNDSGGSSLGLLKALSYGNCVLTVDTLSNREVAGNSALFYKKSISDLTAKMKLVLHSKTARMEFKKKAVKRIQNKYSWKKTVGIYDTLLKRL